MNQNQSKAMLVLLITGFVQNKITSVFETTLYMISPRMQRLFFILLVCVELVYLLSNQLIIAHSYRFVDIFGEDNMDF